MRLKVLRVCGSISGCYRCRLILVIELHLGDRKDALLVQITKFNVALFASQKSRRKKVFNFSNGVFNYLSKLEAHTLYWTELSLNSDSTTRVRDQRTENTTRPESETREQRTRHDQSQRAENMTTKVREQRTRHNQSQRVENTTQPKSESREHDTT